MNGGERRTGMQKQHLGAATSQQQIQSGYRNSATMKPIQLMTPTCCCRMNCCISGLATFCCCDILPAAAAAPACAAAAPAWVIGCCCYKMPLARSPRFA